MEITIGMLVGSRERQRRYKETIQRLLAQELLTVEFAFYISLEKLYEDMVCGNVRADILLLQAGLQNFEFARELRALDRNCLFLYPAKDMALVLRAFESMPMAYVPVQGAPSAPSLEQAILQAVAYVKKMKSEIRFDTKSACLRYALHEIDYFESQYRLVHIVKRNKKVETITARLDHVQGRLPPSFYRCHQSYLVNMGNIAFIDKTNREAHFRSGQIVPSSKKLFSGFLEAYRNFGDGGDIGAGVS